VPKNADRFPQGDVPMRLSSLFGKRPFTSRSRCAAPVQQAARFRPRLEALEDRSLPSAGSLDPAFGNGGLVTTNLGWTSDQRVVIAQQADGKTIAAGSTPDQNGIADFALVRYQTDGSLDPTFGSGGVVKTAITSYGAHIQTIALQINGQIV